MEALALEDEEEAELALKHAIRRLYLALICQTVGSVPFKSPVLSFCAMLSQKVCGKGQGLWEELGNFNSQLSALTWTAQLMLFDQPVESRAIHVRDACGPCEITASATNQVSEIDALELVSELFFRAVVILVQDLGR